MLEPSSKLANCSSADSAPDDQIESHKYPCDVDTNEKHSHAVSKAIAERRSSRRVKFEVDFGIEVERNIFGRIADDGPHRVEIPYSEWIEYLLVRDFRGQKQFFDLIDALAVLNYQQRQTIGSFIQASLADFAEALPQVLGALTWAY